jgi:hypothetical protein
MDASHDTQHSESQERVFGPCQARENDGQSSGRVRPRDPHGSRREGRERRFPEAESAHPPDAPRPLIAAANFPIVDFLSSFYRRVRADHARGFRGSNQENIMPRKESSSSKTVESAMHRKKAGTLKSGSGHKVTSRKQAIAIGLNEAREKGANVPPARSSSSRKHK